MNTAILKFCAIGAVFAVAGVAAQTTGANATPGKSESCRKRNATIIVEPDGANVQFEWCAADAATYPGNAQRDRYEAHASGGVPEYDRSRLFNCVTEYPLIFASIYPHSPSEVGCPTP